MDIMSPVYLTNIYRTVHPKVKEYTFSAPHGTFSKNDHVLETKKTLTDTKKLE